MNSRIRPIASHCLIQRTKSEEQKTKSGIILQASDENFEEGIVISIGNKLDSEKDQFDKDLQVGSKVLFDKRRVIYEGNDEDFLVPFNAIVALLDKPKLVVGSTSFFDIPSFDDMRGKESSAWEHYQNIKTFRISSQFLTPFAGIDQIFRFNHELVYETLREIQEVDYRDISGSITEDKKTLATRISDDVWDCEYKFEINDHGLDLDFTKVNTDVFNLCKTLPTLLEPYSETMKSNLFQRFSDQDFSKAKRVMITFNQEIKLIGVGTMKRQIKNSDVMQQFLKLKSDQESKEKPLLDALSFNPEDVGRIDVNISFKKKIKNNMYNVFLRVQAPANDENSLLDITWNIIDNDPGVIPDRNFGEIFSEFFVNTVLKGFYDRWFKQNIDVNVITLKK